MRPSARCAAALLVWAVLAGGAPAFGQVNDPVDGVVGDLRLLTVSLPTSAGWTPPSPESGALTVPGRGFGAEAGAHVVFGPGRHRRLGLGATTLVAQGRATDAEGASTITSRLVVLAPHVSANFGHRLGWSYLSGGVGLTRVTSTEDGATDDAASWGTVFHYGGGARWFLNERVAVSLDLRFWALTPRAASLERPSAPATTRVAFGAGVSFR